MTDQKQLEKQILSDNAVYRVTDMFSKAYLLPWYTKKETVAIKGSRGSGKSIFAARWHIWHMMKYEGANSLVVRANYNTLKDSCFTELIKAIHFFKADEYWDSTLNPLELKFYKDKDRSKLPRKILFRGMDDATKITSITVDNGYLCWVWFEEASLIKNYQEVDKVLLSIRGIPPESGLWTRFTFTFNPWSPTHWLKAKYFDIQSPNILAMTTTYKDNPFLDKRYLARLLEQIEISPKAAVVNVYGEWGISEGVIYDNWDEYDFDPNEIAARPGIISTFGLDFGYATSYNAFVALFVDQDKHEVYIYDEMYERGMTNLDIAKRITQMGYAKEHIIADCAEPKSISELKAGMIDEEIDQYGVPHHTRYSLPNLEGAMKGPDSVRNGIQRNQQYRVYVHPKCKNTIMEFNIYAWKIDKDGNITGEPDKESDHIMDAWRYAMNVLYSRGHAKVAVARGAEPVKKLHMYGKGTNDKVIDTPVHKSRVVVARGKT